MNLDKIKKDLVDEIKLTGTEADVFLLLVREGKMEVSAIAKNLGISEELALSSSKKIMGLGGFIELKENEFETMHPRFSAVNMYRRMCESANIKFGRNKIVDNIGVILEPIYENARTK